MICDCGNKEFYATFEYKGNCIIDEKENWIRDIQVTEAEFFGPYKCVNCGRKYKKLS